ncbi:PH domain-containing protein [Weeksellaceae bacterium TAE3-ERU29]|nr:PH domain-containing protein [Weeksellaceae bacterium TAE3-ERU29]
MTEDRKNNVFIDFNKIPYERIEKKYIYVKWLNLVITYLIVFIGIIIGAIVTDFPLLYSFLSIIGWTIICGSWIIYSKKEIQKRKYAITENFIIYYSGLFLETTEIVPLTRVQHTSLDQGWISKKFGLGSLVVYTAGNDETLAINGLKYETAKKHNSFLLNHIDDDNETSLISTDEE